MRVLWFHGSSVQEPDRGFPEEFDRMRGATLSRTTGLRPRPQAEVTVRFPEPRHPITDGLPAEWAVVNDDVLTGARLDPSATVLLTVFDDVETYRRAGWPNAHTPVDVRPAGSRTCRAWTPARPWRGPTCGAPGAASASSSATTGTPSARSPS